MTTTPSPSQPSKAAITGVSAYAPLADVYDHWYADWYKDETTWKSVVEVLRGIGADINPGWRILDTAGGTGHPTIAARLAGYAGIVATDGSADMLRVMARNCDRENVPSEAVSTPPISWTDEASYVARFGSASFDLILNLGHCFWHLPPAPERGQALDAFYTLLKPGGYLVIDTKKYMQLSSGPDEKAASRELYWNSKQHAWMIRDRRTDVSKEGPRNLFHTKLFYDTDPVRLTERVLLTVTIEVDGNSSPVVALSGYPLPVEELRREMEAHGFTTRLFETKPEEYEINPERYSNRTRYDIVVGHKPVDS